MSAVAPGPRWVLTLYVNGASPRSTQAITALRRICDEDLVGAVDLTVIDAVLHPDAVVHDHIVALPTLVKHAPDPVRHLVGDLADLDRVRHGLDLGPAADRGPGPDVRGGR